MEKSNQQKRVNVAITNSSYIDLSRHAVEMSASSGKRISRQSILDSLIAIMISDEKIKKKIEKSLF